MQHLEFPIISFLLVFFLLCSLPSHIRARNISLISLILWLTVTNIIHGVNSVVWAGNVAIQLQVWCDITTKILIGFSIAVPLSVFCISRQLERISSNRQSIFTEAEKHRRRVIEAVLCFGVPLLFMALHYIFQGHRFDIVEDIGCNPATYVSIPTIICLLIPPVLISLTSLVYSLAAVHHFLKRRIEFVSVLRNSNSAMTPSRYFRLLLFALSDIFFHSAATLLVLYFDVQNGVNPYVSWKFVHLDFSRIGLFPLVLIPPTIWKEQLFAWWVPPTGSILFIVLFGFNQEAVSDYIAVWTWFEGHVKPLVARFRTEKDILPTHIRIRCSRQVILSDNPTPTSMRPKSWDAESSSASVDLAESPSVRSSSDLNKLESIPNSSVVRPIPARLPHRFSTARPFSSCAI